MNERELEHATSPQMNPVVGDECIEESEDVVLINGLALRRGKNAILTGLRAGTLSLHHVPGTEGRSATH